MSVYTFPIPIGTTGNTYQAKIGELYRCEGETYIDNPQILFTFRAKDTYNNYSVCISSTAETSGLSQYDERVAISIGRITSQNFIEIFRDDQFTNGGTFDGSYGISESPTATPTTSFRSTLLPAGNYGSWSSYMYTGILEWELTSNIPIFETDAQAITYITTGEGIEQAVNYSYEERESKEFIINNIWTHGTWTPNGLSGMGSQNYRLVRGKLIEGGRISFYPKPGIVDGALQYGIISSGIFDALQYSEDGVTWHDSSVFPYSFFYKERTNELGEFDFGLTFFSQIPAFEDEETAQKWIDEDPSVSIEDATNWPQISGKYPPSNSSGSALPQSQFGEVKLKGFFSQQYICDTSLLQNIANDLFDTSQGGFWEAIKKGVEAYGDSPIQSVMGLSFWPFDVTSLIGSGNYSPAQYVWFGGYGWDTTGKGSCNQIIYASGHKDIGTVRLIPHFNSWRDYEPYTKLYVSIPYCGTYQLDLKRYWNKDVTVRYWIDTRTNGCICGLIADGYLMDYFNGQMGVTMPITLTDYSAYMNSQMQVLLQGGGQAVTAGGNAIGAITGKSGAALAGAAAGSMAGAGIAGAITGAKTVYGLMQNNINNFNVTKGGSSSMINCFLPQTVDFIFEMQDSCEPANYEEMFGVPSLAQGSLFNFSGFLKCQSVKLECPKATEREKERLKQMLLSGIYI